MTSTLTRWFQTRRWAAAARMFVCAAAIVGILPGVHELVETVEHLWHDGHLPHGEAHDARAEHHRGDAEHGCAPLDHHCGCCTSLVATPPGDTPELGAPRGLADVAARVTAAAATGPERAIPPPVRPPIA